MRRARHLSAAAISISIAILIALAAPVHAASQIRTSGSLSVPEDSPVMAFCTDPVMQQILDEDFRASRHTFKRTGKTFVTLTVTMHEQLLQPGVSLGDVAPGDPGAAALLQQLGAQPIPLGDSGDQPPDPYESVARLEAEQPDNPTMAQFRNYQAMKQSQEQPLPQSGGVPGVPLEQQYPTAIIARVTSSGREGALTVASLVMPGDDIHDAKELIAEEIANDVLH
jgi:hypothetical protein